MATVPTSQESPSEIQETVDEILQRPAYTGVAQSPISRFLRDNPITRFFLDLWQRFLDWLQRLGLRADDSNPTAERAQDRTSGGPLIIILAAILVALVAYRLAKTREDADSLARRADEAGDATAAELERLAEAAESRGEYNEAVRLRFQAGLSRLDDAGAVELEPGLITGQVRSALAMREFDAVANQFERAAYSEREVTAADADSASEGWRDIFRVLRRGSGEESE